MDKIKTGELFSDEKKRSWNAAVMGMTMTGMGQIYNRELLKGVCFFVIFIFTLLAGFRLSVHLPDKFLILGIAITLMAVLSVYIFSVFDAYKKGKVSDGKKTSTHYNHWYFYIAVWMIGTLFVTGTALNYTKDKIIQAYKIPAESMEPAILKGDHILADKSAYSKRSPKLGDVIIFVYPDDRSKAFMKRIAGLPNDTVKLDNGKEVKVPHGKIYVIGDNRGRSVDSRKFGFVPLEDVVGKVRQIYYSSGKDGVRWSRIGLIPDKVI